MRIARVVGNVVSTIKEETHYGRKMMIIEYLDLDLKPIGTRDIAPVSYTHLTLPTT